MLKVTSASIGSPAGDGTILTLEGRLAGEWVEEFSRAAREAQPNAGGSLTLDLAGLTFVDARGAAVLRALRSGGARLVGESSFVAALVAGSTR